MTTYDQKMEMAIHSNNPVRHPGWDSSPFTADKDILNEWHHLAVAYSSNEKSVRVYFDGELDAEGKWGPLPGTFGPGRIGSWSGGGREWEGMFDEMILFDVALEAADIQMLMENGLEATLAVEPAGKLGTIWGEAVNFSIRSRHTSIGFSPNICGNWQILCIPHEVTECLRYRFHQNQTLFVSYPAFFAS